MNITFNINDNHVPRIVEAMKNLYPQPTTQFTDSQWVKQCIRRWILEQVKRWEQSRDMQKAKKAVDVSDDIVV